MRKGRCNNHGTRSPADLPPGPPSPPPLGAADSETTVSAENMSVQHSNQGTHNHDIEPIPCKLPAFTEMSSSDYTWSDIKSGADFTHAITAAYAEIVHWRRNLFLAPSGKAGKRFIAELSRLFLAYAECTALEPIALKAAMVMPTLLLQKPHATPKARDHVTFLHCHLQSWQDSDINILIVEGHTIQHRLNQIADAQTAKAKSRAHTFSKMMMQGKVRATLRLLSDVGNGAPLPLDTLLPTGEHQPPTTVHAELLKKHPPGQPAHPDGLLHPTIPPPCHPVVFECLDGASICTAALHTNGSAGP